MWAQRAMGSAGSRLRGLPSLPHRACVGVKAAGDHMVGDRGASAVEVHDGLPLLGGDFVMDRE